MGCANKSKICSHNMSRTTQRPCSADGPSLLNLAQQLITTVSPGIRLLFVIPVLFASMTRGSNVTESCGGFFSVYFDKVGHFITPELGNRTRCIWIMEAPLNCTVNLTVELRAVAFLDKHCYLEVRDGGQEGKTLLGNSCNGSSWTVPLVGRTRWMHILFENDDPSPRGVLSLNYTTFNKKPVKSVNPTECYNYQSKCTKNQLCISFAYVCDFFDDCGCGEPGVCDEEGCDSKILDFTVTLSLALAIGFVLGIPLVVAGMLLEKRHNWEKIVQTSLRLQETGEGRPKQGGSLKTKSTVTKQDSLSSKKSSESHSSILESRIASITSMTMGSRRKRHGGPASQDTAA